MIKIYPVWQLTGVSFEPIPRENNELYWYGVMPDSDGGIMFDECQSRDDRFAVRKCEGDLL